MKHAAYIYIWIYDSKANIKQCVYTYMYIFILYMFINVFI